MHSLFCKAEFFGVFVLLIGWKTFTGKKNIKKSNLKNLQNFLNKIKKFQSNQFGILSKIDIL